MVTDVSVCSVLSFHAPGISARSASPARDQILELFFPRIVGIVHCRDRMTFCAVIVALRGLDPACE
jgi:hypothetical protein